MHQNKYNKPMQLNNNTETTETTDLADILSQATETKIVLDIPEIEKEQQEQFKNDFDENLLNAADEEEIKETAQQAATDALFDNEQLAPAIIDTFDILMQKTLPIVYEKTLDESDRIAMKFMLRQFKAGTLDKNPNADGLRLIEIMQDYQTYIDSLPITKSEKQSILIPLKQVLKNVNIQTTPEKALLYSVAMMLIPRAIPLAKNQFFGDSKEETK